MADYSEGGVECKSSNIVELRKQVLSLVTRKFEGTIEKPIDDVVSGVLLKRRKKWRRRHHLSSEVTSRPPDPALRDEKEQLTDQYYQSGERLLVCRRSSYALARELEREKRKLQLQAAERYHKGTPPQQSLESRSNEPPAAEVTHSILKDLQAAVSQVDTFVKVRQMKLSMTPRLPPLHRRGSLDTTNEQFGMSLLVPPQQVMQSSRPDESGEGVADGTSSTHPVLRKLLSSDTSLPPGAGCEDTLMEVSTKGGEEDIPSTNGVEEHINLDPAVELSPVNREREDSPESLPRIACVMSLMEGQDTASVVEVLAENDMVIETHSSLGLERDPAEDSQTDSMLDERLITENVLPLLPEKEEIVSTTPDNDEEVSCNPPASSVDNNHIQASPENLKDSTNHITADEELVEMIMKDSELAAWIAKARLRPRTPISYSQTRKHRSRSRSSSIHD